MKDNKEQQIKALRLYIDSLGVTSAELYPVEQVEGSSRNWEIIEFRAKETGASLVLKDDGLFNTPNGIGSGINLNKILFDNIFVDFDNWLIYSVRRLSDGVVFKVGDKVCWNWAEWKTPYEIIEKFEVKNDKIDAKMKSGYCYTNICNESYTVGWVKHYSEPVSEKPKVILTTTDGVEITDRKQSVYLVDSNRCNAYDSAVPYGSVNDPLRWLRFSTKEAAERYVIENKPMFSINDLLKLEREGGFRNGGSTIVVSIKILHEEAAKRINQ